MAMEAPWELIRSSGKCQKRLLKAATSKAWKLLDATRASSSAAQEIKKRHQGIRLLLDFLKEREEQHQQEATEEDEDDEEEEEEQVQQLIALLPDLLLCLRDHNFKIAAMGLEILAMIVRKLPESVLRNYFKSLWNTLVEKLGDSKIQVREQAVQVIVELADLFGFDAIRERIQPCLGHKNWRTREQVLAFYWRCFEHLDLFETKYKDVIDDVLKALEDSSKEVRDTAMVTLTKFYEHLETPFWRFLETKRIRSAHMRTLAERLSGINDETNGAIRAWQETASARSQGSSVISPSQSSTSSGAPPRTANRSPPSFDGLPDHDHITTAFGGGLSSVELSDLSAFGDKLHKNEDWVTRVDTLQKLRNLASQLPQDKHAAFSQGIRSIREHLCDQVGDLRSVVAREACLTIQTIAQVLADAFNPHAEFFVASLLKATFVTIQVISTAANECVRKIIQSTRSGYARLIVKFIEGAKSRNQVLRHCCVSYLTMVFEQWNRSMLSKYCEPLVMLLPTALRDAVGDVRVASRKLYWAFHQTFEREAQDLFDLLDPAIQKTLLEGRPIHSSQPAQTNQPILSAKPPQRSPSPPPQFSVSSAASRTTTASSAAPTTATSVATSTSSSSLLSSGVTHTPAQPSRTVLGGKPLRVPLDNKTSGFGSFSSSNGANHSSVARVPERVVASEDISSSTLAAKRRALEGPASILTQGARRLPNQQFAFSDDIAEMEGAQQRRQFSFQGGALRVPAPDSPAASHTKGSTAQPRQFSFRDHPALRVFSEELRAPRSPSKSSSSDVGSVSLPLPGSSTRKGDKDEREGNQRIGSSKSGASKAGGGPRRFASEMENEMSDDEVGQARSHVDTLSLRKNEKSSVDANLLLAENGLWSARLEALNSLAASIGLPESALASSMTSETSIPADLPTEFDERIVQCFVKHLSDGHYRVGQVALKSFALMAKCAPAQISRHLKTSLPNLFQRLVDSKEQLRVCAKEILDLYMEQYDSSLLMAHVIPLFAEGSNMKVKVFIGKFLVELLPHSQQYMKQSTSHIRILLTRIAQVYEKECPVAVASVCGDLMTSLSREYPKELAATVPILPPSKRSAISKILKVRGILLNSPAQIQPQTQSQSQSQPAGAASTIASKPNCEEVASRPLMQEDTSQTLSSTLNLKSTPASDCNSPKSLEKDDTAKEVTPQSHRDGSTDNNQANEDEIHDCRENQTEIATSPKSVECHDTASMPLKHAGMKRSRRRSSEEQFADEMTEQKLILDELLQSLRNNNKSSSERTSAFYQTNTFRKRFMNGLDEFSSISFGRICAALVDAANDNRDFAELTFLGNFFLSFPAFLGQQHFGSILHQLVDSIDQHDVKAHLIEMALTRMIRHVAQADLVLDELASLVLISEFPRIIVVLRLLRFTLSTKVEEPHQEKKLEYDSALLLRVAKAVAAKLYADNSLVRKEAVQCLVLLHFASGPSKEFQSFLAQLDLAKQKLVACYVELQLRNHQQLEQRSPAIFPSSCTTTE